MKKRLIACITALIFMFYTTVFSDYYPEVERINIPFSEMLEYEMDYNKTLKALEKADKLVNNGATVTKIFETIDKALPEDGIDFITRNDLNYILAAIDNSEENNAKYFKSSDYVVDIQQKLLNIIKKLYDSGYKQELCVLLEMSDEEIVEVIESIPSNDEYKIQKELNALVEVYYNKMFGTHVIEVDGKDYNFYDLLAADKEIVYNNLLKYFEESSDILVPIFIDMVNKRNEFSKAAGYVNYMEYAYAECYKKDYTASDRESFYKNTAKYIVPLYNELVKLVDVVYNGYVTDDPDLTEDEIIKFVKGGLERIHPELTEAYDYMIEYELYDIAISENKKPGGFTTLLDFFKVPYMFINPENSVSNMFNSLIHEYGHYNAAFHSPKITDSEYSKGNGINLDIAEIHSQGLEMIFMDELGKIYGSDSPAVRVENLMYTLDSIIAGSLYSMWQEKVYVLATEKNITKEEINKLFISCCRELGVEEFYLYTDLGCEWIMIPHNFEVPFYYLSYGVSAMTALEVLGNVQKDRKSGIDKYMLLSAMGDHVPFRKTLEECGYSNVFAESTFDDAVNTVYSYTGLGYKDISVDDWYYPYIIRIANYFSSKKADCFYPENHTTRLEFVDALGKMEEDIYGLADMKSYFSDTDSSYVAWAENKGIVAGISDTEFGSYQSITREQIICFIYRLAGEPEVSGSLLFDDSDNISDWASDAVLWAQTEGIASGYTDNTFRPKNNVTRGEAAKFLADAYKTYY